MGHFFRSLEIARALNGHEVVMVTGGPEAPADFPPHVRHEQLPGLRMDENFSTLLPTEDQEGRDLDDIRQERVQRLLQLLHEFKPQTFMVELFPFGRRQFSFELIPALEAARSGQFGHCRTVCSLRDILVEKRNREKYENRVLRVLNPLFDLVMVHSDPDLIALGRTFSRMERITPPITYTGYVAQASRPEAGEALRTEMGLAAGEKLLVASAGSGSVGGDLLQGALRGAILAGQHRSLRLCLFTGPLLEEALFQSLCREAAPHPWIRVARFTRRFPAYLAAADLSISLGGYNTVMNLLASRTFGLVLPFSQNREQGMRAELLQECGLLRVLRPDDLDGESLAGLILDGLQQHPTEVRVNLQGARQTARCLESLEQPKQRGAVRHTVCQPCRDGNAPKELLENFFSKLRSLRSRYPDAHIHFRADDVAVPGGNIQRLLELFLELEHPLMLAAVPAWLRADRWHELQRMSRGSALFTWGQHGWRHANHEPCGKKCEFGPARLPKHKHLDLLKGRDRLAAIMGKDFTPIFTPPWNRMDQDSLELLPKLGFRGVSADTKLRPRSAYVRDSMAFLPVHVDLHTRQENTPQEALRGILQDFSNALPLGECGVMLHHQRMNPAAFLFLQRLLQAI